MYQYILHYWLKFVTTMVVVGKWYVHIEVSTLFQVGFPFVCSLRNIVSNIYI